MKRIFEVSNAGVKVVRMKRKEELSVICIEVVVQGKQENKGDFSWTTQKGVDDDEYVAQRWTATVLTSDQFCYNYGFCLRSSKVDMPTMCTVCVCTPCQKIGLRNIFGILAHD